MPKSWRPEVIADATGEWIPNGLRFATEKEAYESARVLSWRWIAVRNFRAAESDDPVNYTYADGKLEPLDAAPA
jgi:hypothetical protein